MTSAMANLHTHPLQRGRDRNNDSAPPAFLRHGRNQSEQPVISNRLGKQPFDEFISLPGTE